MELTQTGAISDKGYVKPEELVNIIKDTSPSAFLDTWGPTNVVQIYNPDINMQANLVIDNTTMGPGIGEIMISPYVTPRQIFNNARKMTLTSALANINFGGAAASINADPDNIDISKYIRAFARGVSPYVPEHFIAAPGRNVGQMEMAAFVDEIGDRIGATGKPEEIGGIPYELGVIGFGIAVVIENALDVLRRNDVIEDSNVAIQGLDHNGYVIAKYLAKKGVNLVAISDETRMVNNRAGIEIDEVSDRGKGQNNKYTLVNTKEKSKPHDILKTECDMLILNDTNDILTDDNVVGIKTKCLVEGTSEPISPYAEQLLNKNRMLILPDILTMMGGPISSFNEYSGNDVNLAFSMINSKSREITTKAIHKYTEMGIPLRRIVNEMAKETIMNRMEVER